MPSTLNGMLLNGDLEEEKEFVPLDEKILENKKTQSNLTALLPDFSPGTQL